jgi:hypothetical protein
MIFLEKISNLKSLYHEDACGLFDGAFLYGIFAKAPPLAKHIIFPPMPSDVMQNLVSSYKSTFPEELLLLYHTMNGADLFWTVRLIGKKGIRIPLNCLSIYGAPLTHDRKKIEPFNISIEDLRRPNGTPTNWLKFGSYYCPEDLSNRLDLFVDTDTSNVFAVKHGSEECMVVKEWNTIDNCLCHLYDEITCRLR